MGKKCNYFNRIQKTNAVSYTFSTSGLFNYMYRMLVLKPFANNVSNIHVHSITRKLINTHTRHYRPTQSYYISLYKGSENNKLIWETHTHISVYWKYKILFLTVFMWRRYFWMYPCILKMREEIGTYDRINLTRGDVSCHICDNKRHKHKNVNI